jgi:hypothetical protein
MQARRRVELFLDDFLKPYERIASSVEVRCQNDDLLHPGKCFITQEFCFIFFCLKASLCLRLRSFFCLLVSNVLWDQRKVVGSPIAGTWTVFLAVTS